MSATASRIAPRATVRWRAVAAPRTAEQIGRAAVVVYAVLWLTEGAFRKWLPATGSLMYVARDAVLIGFVLVQYAVAPRRRGALPSVLFWSVTGLLLLLAAAQVVLVGDPLEVVAVGLRNYLAPVAFAYVFWRFWRPQGPLLVRLLLVAAPVEFAVTALQVVSPQSSFINLSTSGDGTGLGNGDVVRGSGTFSDAGVLATFVTIVFALCLGLLADPDRRIRRRFVVIGLASALMTMAVAGERTAVFGSAAVLVVWLLRELLRAELRSTAIAVSVLAALGALFGLALLLYPTALTSFGARFVQASQQENSADRVLGSATDFLAWPLTALGDGAGSHSNAALALGSTDVWIESELTRWVAELGVLGLVLVVARVSLGLVLGARVVLGLTTLNAVFITMSCVVGPQLVAGSISVNPGSEGAAAIGFALLIWSSTLPRARSAVPRRRWTARA